MGKAGLQNYGGLYSTHLTKEQADTLQCYPDRDLIKDGAPLGMTYSRLSQSC